MLGRRSRTFPPSVARAFEDLASQQRGSPESAMLRVQHAAGGGVLNTVVENAGDLIHRMSEYADVRSFNAGYPQVKPKIESLQRRFKHPYGFAREHAENLRHNADYYKIPVSEMRAKVDATLKKYAHEHAELPTYNQAQCLAKQAAVAVGQQRWTAAEHAVDALAKMMPNPRVWVRHARSFRLGPDGRLKLRACPILK
jgi:hypothetical protein